MARDQPAADSRGRAQRASSAYRLTGVGLFLLGIIAAGIAISDLLVDYRGLFIAFAGVGLFGSLLLFFLRPDATSEADPVEHVYTALVANSEALARDADLSDRHIYAPTSYEESGFTPVCLTVPSDEQDRISIDRNRRPVFDSAETLLSPDAVTLYPTGAALFDAFEGVLAADLSSDPVELAAQLSDGAVDGLELADAVDIAVDPDDGTATVTADRPRFGPLTRFDHPVASFVAVGFASSLDVPIILERGQTDGDPSVTCQWSPDRVGTGAEVATRGQT